MRVQRQPPGRHLPQARAARRRPPAPEEVATPHVETIAALAQFLNVPESATAKAIFLIAEVEQPDGQVKEQFVFVVVRGDMG